MYVFFPLSQLFMCVKNVFSDTKIIVLNSTTTVDLLMYVFINVFFYGVYVDFMSLS